MNLDKFLEEQYRISFTAGMNQRYHQFQASRWEWWNRGISILVAIFAFAGAVLAFVPGAVAWPRIIACAAALLAIALNVLPIGQWAKNHFDLFRRWTDLREEVDAMLFEVMVEPTESQIERLRNLDGKLHRICGVESACNEKALRKYHDAEKISREPSIVAA